jgi:hypothetical protein
MSEAKKTKNPPVARVKTGYVTGAIWARDAGDSGTFYDVTFQRAYRDGKRQWKNSTSFDLNGLLALQHAVGLAIDKVQELRAADISDKPGDAPAPEDIMEEEIAF